MHLFFSRAVWTLLGLAACAGTAAAQTPSLHEAVEAAWALSPQARALQNRQLELDARSRAASSFISGPPSVLLANRTDRVGRNGGFREYEAEIAAPLWRAGVRAATASQVDADRDSFERQQSLARAKLAGEVRDIAAGAALAHIELQVASRRLAEATQLAGDLERRVRVGDAARVDWLQAQSLVQLAAGAQGQALSALRGAQAHWLSLTGLTQVSTLDESEGVPQAHPAVAAATSRLRAAEARLALTQKDSNDPVEVSLGLMRERESLGAVTETRMRVAVRIPFGGDGRHAAKLAAAFAELDVARAEVLVSERAAQADRSVALADLEAARLGETLAAVRAKLSAEAQELVARSYRLGESDLPTRLRADNDHFDAELSHARAAVATRRAIARLNQASGVQP